MKRHILICILTPSLAWAFDISGLMGGPPGPPKTTLGYTGLFHQQAEVGPDQTQTSYQIADASVPVYVTEEKKVILSASGSELKFDPEQSSTPDLYDIKFGASYSEKLDENRSWSLSLRVGSSSDKHFYNESVTTLGATAVYTPAPASETGRWIYLVDFSNNRPILNGIPLPGFAYVHTPSKTYRAVYGAPFAFISWDFAEKMNLDFFYLIPWVIKTSVGYKPLPFVRIYAGVDFSQNTYYLADRQNNWDRLFYDEKKLFLGARGPVSKNIYLEAEIGHAFDRTMFVAENYEREPVNG